MDGSYIGVPLGRNCLANESPVSQRYDCLWCLSLVKVVGITILVKEYPEDDYDRIDELSSSLNGLAFCYHISTGAWASPIARSPRVTDTSVDMYAPHQPPLGLASQYAPHV